MPAERAGFTVTMFLIDTSPSMGTIRSVELPPGPNGEHTLTEMTHLEWALQFVKLKIQEMIYNGRKTDQCGVIVFGAEETKNRINEANGGYENVFEYLEITQPSSTTLAKLDDLKPSNVAGDPIDALIVGIDTQENYLSSKKTWTRKIILITDGESPIELEDWEATVGKMNTEGVHLTVVGVDFNDDEFPFIEPNKTEMKRINEEFYATMMSRLNHGVMGTYAYALQEASRPDIKTTRSTLMGNVLRLGDVDVRSDEAFEINVKTSKCTAFQRPKGWKKYALRGADTDKHLQMPVDGEGAENNVYVPLKMRTEFYVNRTENEEDDDLKAENYEDNNNLLGAEIGRSREELLEKVDKEDLVRGFKYGTTYAPCPDGQFPKLQTRKGIDICGFFGEKNFRRDYSMGEVQYVWAEPKDVQQQSALSSIVQAMYEKGVYAIARWVSKDGADPKMGVLKPGVYEKVDCLMWVQMPFADDVRQYSFASLDRLLSKKGDVITKHPYIPTEAQQEAMDDFVESMDLMEAGDKNEEGQRMPWYDPLQSYNPALHRIKQAIFHSAVVSDISSNPLAPPHPELLKYFDPPRRVLKRSWEATEKIREVFKIKEVPKKVARLRKNGHEHAEDRNDSVLLLDRKDTTITTEHQIQGTVRENETSSVSGKLKTNIEDNSNKSDTESDDDEGMLLDKKKQSTPPSRRRENGPLPTPARSVSPIVDPGRTPGRIVGSTFPFKDFQRNLAQDVSKAIEDLSVVITEVVMRPFTSRRSDEMIRCMEILRDTCLKENKIDAWNSFLQDLKGRCLSKPGNVEFWEQVKKVGQTLTLIGTVEASKTEGAF